MSETDDPIDIEELSFEVRKLLMQRLKCGDIDNDNLVRLMPWVAPRCVSESDVRYEVTHRFEVIKPQLIRSQLETHALTSLEDVEGENEIVESTEQTEEVN